MLSPGWYLVKWALLIINIFYMSSLPTSCVFTFLRVNNSHSPSEPLNTVPLIVKLASGSINPGESPIINCSPSLRIPYCVSRKRLGGLATVSSSSSSATSSYPCLGACAEGRGRGTAFSPRLPTAFRLAQAQGRRRRRRRRRAAPCRASFVLGNPR